MSRGKRPKPLRPILAASLIAEVLIYICGDRVLAESFSLQDLGQLEKQPTVFAPSILTQLPNPNTPVPPTPPEQPNPTPQPSPETPLDIPPTTPPGGETPGIPGNITVTRFEFEGNTAFSQEELAKVTAQFLNRPISFAELLQAEAAVSKLYTDAGYINSGAVIPADQTLSQKNAVVRIQIIEGGIEDIEITGTKKLNPDYIRSRIALGTERPLNREQLLEALQVLQLDPLIENLSAELSTGSRPELSLLTVRVTEAESFDLEIFADNSRVPSVGSFRRGMRLSELNLTGLGDRLQMEYTNTDGSNALNLGYTVPFNPRNGTVSLAVGVSDTEVIEYPFEPVDITGDSFNLQLDLRQPVLLTPTQELALGVTLSRQESQTEIGGEPNFLSAGADANGETTISAMRFFQEYVERSPQDVFALRSQFSLGIGDVLDSTVNDEPPDSRFFSWRGQGQYVRLLAPETLFVLRSDLQFATRALVPLEQFGVGGAQTVRGYRQDLLLTDNGFLASAEVRLPVLRVEEIEGVLQIVPFVDFGIGWNSSGNEDPDPNALVGVGLGLQWQMGDDLTARFDWGIPLTDVDSSERTWQENGLYFSVNYNFF
jgi:hemolysin activation/secretion protein